MVRLSIAHGLVLILNPFERREQTYIPGDGVWLSDGNLLMETWSCNGVANRTIDRCGVGSSNAGEHGENGDDAERLHF